MCVRTYIIWFSWLLEWFLISCLFRPLRVCVCVCYLERVNGSTRNAISFSYSLHGNPKIERSAAQHVNRAHHQVTWKCRHLSLSLCVCVRKHDWVHTSKWTLSVSACNAPTRNWCAVDASAQRSRWVCTHHIHTHTSRVCLVHAAVDFQS